MVTKNPQNVHRKYFWHNSSYCSEMLIACLQKMPLWFDILIFKFNSLLCARNVTVSLKFKLVMPRPQVSTSFKCHLRIKECTQQWATQIKGTGTCQSRKPQWQPIRTKPHSICLANEQSWTPFLVCEFISLDQLRFRDGTVNIEKYWNLDCTIWHITELLVYFVLNFMFVSCIEIFCKTCNFMDLIYGIWNCINLLSYMFTYSNTTWDLKEPNLFLHNTNLMFIPFHTPV